MNNNNTMRINYVSVGILRPAEYNPRRWDKEAENQLKESIKKYGIVDPLLVNSAKERKNIVIGGHFRLSVIKELNIKMVPVVYINIPDIEKEKELNIRLNKNTGEFDWDLLAKFDESFLSSVGFSSEELDDIFAIDENPEQFDLEKELKKLNIDKITIKKGVPLRCPRMGWVGQGQHLFWWRILLCKIRNSEAKKERFKNPPAFLPRPLLRAGRKPRRGNSIPPEK